MASKHSFSRTGWFSSVVCGLAQRQMSFASYSQDLQRARLRRVETEALCKSLSRGSCGSSTSSLLFACRNDQNPVI